MGTITFGYPNNRNPKIIITLSDHGWFEIKDYKLRKKAEYCFEMYKDKNGKWRTRTNKDYIKSIIVSGNLTYEFLGEKLCEKLFEEPPTNFLGYEYPMRGKIYDITDNLDTKKLKKVADVIFERYKNHPRIQKLLKENKINDR
jgi:hypothetical protein